MNQKTPAWVWFSLLPYIGSIGIIYAGKKIHRFSWINTGIFMTVLGLILSPTHLAGFVWLGQIAIAFTLKDEFIKCSDNNAQLPNRFDNTIGLLPKTQAKIEVNNCSKDDLVYGLDLPIVYANEIESALKEGYIFTHVEELMSIAGIPDSYLSRLESLVVFSYDINKEADVSWRRCNTFSEQELLACNLEPQVAAIIVKEREQKGMYRSFPDLRKRTGLPLQKLTALL